VQAQIANICVEARKHNAVVADYPGVMPSALDEAYQIQDAGIALVGKAVGGWKVGRIPNHLVDVYGSNRLAGPVFSDQIVEPVDDAVPAVPVLKGFAAVEAELMLRVSRTPPQDVTLDQAHEYIDEVRFGLEIASSPFPGINDHGPAVTVSDFGNNFGLVLGPQIVDWRERDLLNAPVALSIDGVVAGHSTLSQMLDGPFGSFRFLAEMLPLRGLALQPGQWVSTGAITGVHKIDAGQAAVAEFDNQFKVACMTIPHLVNVISEGDVS
jgi:2-keto-4-pentenoate hydratase